MILLRSRVALFLLLAACASAIPPNRYGLRVVPDLATYERLARANPDKRLIDLESLGIAIDIRYATPDNFMKQTLYPVAKAYLRAPAARALADANRELRARGLAVKVFDGYRPYRITEKMWEPIRNPDFVADPAKGSRHNRGAAVDLTRPRGSGSVPQRRARACALPRTPAADTRSHRCESPGSRGNRSIRPC